MSNYREYKAEFEDGDVTLTEASTSDREDSISSDYLTAFSAGPVALQNADEGLLVKAWRVQDRDGDVYIASTNGDKWENEELLFSYTGDAIEELDLSFQANGDPVVSAVRPTGTAGAPQIWVYYFDPVEPGFLFDQKADGRTPRGAQDRIVAAFLGTNYVFYINDSEGKIKALDQRDRYGTPHDVLAVDDIGNLYLEAVGRSRVNRIQLEASRHDPTTGRYRGVIFHSPAYPWNAVDEGVSVDADITSVELVQTIFRIEVDAGSDEGELGAGITSIELLQPLVEGSGESEGDISASIGSIELSVPLVEVTAGEDDEGEISGSMASIELVQVIIFGLTSPDEGEISGSIESITLEVP